MSIYDDFSALLSGSRPYMSQFNRNAYADAFASFMEENKPLFERIEAEYTQNEDPKQLIDKLSDAFVMSAKDEYDALKKNKRTSFLIDNNQLMVIYIFPAIQEFTGTFGTELTETLCARWNAAFTQYTIKPSTFDVINGGFKRKLCYVTTAVCLSLGKGENCSEIRILKDYRDHFLSGEADGKQLIDEYYDIAPTIVNRINKEQDAAQTYEKIYRTYINPCIELIHQNRLPECKELYVEMMRTLQKQYLVTRTS